MPTALSGDELSRLLQDDAPCGDLTTESLAIGAAAGRLDFTARGPMVVCGVEEAARLFTLAGARVHLLAGSGTALGAGEKLLIAEGSAAQLHRAWKTAQTLVEWASGIASSAAAIVAEASGVAVACTRKNVPGTKAMSVKAVKAGGAVMHRLGLSETLLLFAEHRLFWTKHRRRPSRVCAAPSRKRRSWSRWATGPRRCAGRRRGPTCCSWRSSAPLRWPTAAARSTPCQPGPCWPQPAACGPTTPPPMWPQARTCS